MIDWVAANWRQEITEDQTAVWYDVLAKLDQRIAFLAIQELRGETQWVPDFKTFLDRCGVIGRRQDALGSGAAPKVCELCGGSAWALSPVFGGVEAYRLCPCQGRKLKECRGGCTCLNCHYGSRAAGIRKGLDGIRTPPDLDELILVPAPSFDQGEF